MKKINWEPKNSKKFVNATIGSVTLQCLPYKTRNSNDQWRGFVFIKKPGFMFVGDRLIVHRYGPFRYSLSKAKEDAVQLARELLLDYQAGLDVELKNFDL